VVYWEHDDGPSIQSNAGIISTRLSTISVSRRTLHQVIIYAYLESRHKINCYGEMCILSSCLNSRTADFVQTKLLIVSMYFGFLLRNIIN